MGQKKSWFKDVLQEQDLSVLQVLAVGKQQKSHPNPQKQADPTDDVQVISATEFTQHIPQRRVKRPLPDFKTFNPSLASAAVPKPSEKKQRTNPFIPSTSYSSPAVVLSKDQRLIHDLVIGGQSVFFTGLAGSGKSHLLRHIISSLRSSYAASSSHREAKEMVVVTASTGLAGYNVGGTSLHSFAGVGLAKDPIDRLIRTATFNVQTLARWKSTKVLIIDEISMLQAEFFDVLDEMGRRLRNNPAPFGGIQLVLCGDFMQLPPPVPNARFLFESKAWAALSLHTYTLSKVFRQSDPILLTVLNEIRIGKVSAESCRILKGLERVPNWPRKPTCLFPLRADVLRVNAKELAILGGEMRRYDASDHIPYGADKKQMEKKLDDSFLATRTLEIKIGALVMVIKNLRERGLFNGQVGCVTGMDEDNVQVLFGEKSVGIGREMFVLDNGRKDVPSRSQFPLVLSYAMSIHKSQGQTLEYLVVDMGKLFEKGQGYTGLSRCVRMDGLQVLNFDVAKIRVSEKVVKFHENLEIA